MFWEEPTVLTKCTILSIPVFGAHLPEYSLLVVSVVSIGHISITAIQVAAISLGSMTASVSGYSVILGLTSALDTVLPSAWTSNEPQLVGLWAQRMTVVVFVSLATPMFLILLNAESIVILLNQEPEVAHLAAIYLRWASLGLPAYASNCNSSRYFQSQGLFAVPTHIVFVVAPVNALLNWLLVWGPSPIRLGFIGAPIATTISFNLISIMSVCYGIFLALKTAWYPLSSLTGKRLQNGGLGNQWLWWLLTLAAQSTLLVSASSTFHVPFALVVATSVRFGNLLGEKNARRGIKYVHHDGVYDRLYLESLMVGVQSPPVSFVPRVVHFWEKQGTGYSMQRILKTDCYRRLHCNFRDFALLAPGTGRPWVAKDYC